MICLLKIKKNGLMTSKQFYFLSTYFKFFGTIIFFEMKDIKHMKGKLMNRRGDLQERANSSKYMLYVLQGESFDCILLHLLSLLS